MIDEQLLKFCEEEPAAAERLAAALRSVVEFYQGRGAMLRSLRDPPKPAPLKLRLVHSDGG